MPGKKVGEDHLDGSVERKTRDRDVGQSVSSHGVSAFLSSSDPQGPVTSTAGGTRCYCKASTSKNIGLHFGSIQEKTRNMVKLVSSPGDSGLETDGRLFGVGETRVW
eukprot:scaffold5966_cov118-Cylindrotheca_fusiformis.AAC.19